MIDEKSWPWEAQQAATKLRAKVSRLEQQNTSLRGKQGVAEQKEDALILSASDIFHYFAPSFNFELDQEALVLEALKRGFVTMTGINQYLVNPNYQGVESND